jgi:glycosyltransferase involved in cell wall biosynthesis
MWSIADLVLLTSDSEGMPLTLIEGQIVGVPGIATRVGSVEEVLIHGETGLLAEPDLTDLTRQLEKLSQNSNLRNEMSRNAKIRAEKIFSIDNMTMKHLDIYHEVLGK